MGLQVVLEERLRPEALVAGGAGERLLSRVDALVVGQFGLVGEALVAHAAGEPVGRRPDLLLLADAGLRVVSVAEPGRRQRGQGGEREGICGDFLRHPLVQRDPLGLGLLAAFGVAASQTLEGGRRFARHLNDSEGDGF